MILFSKVFAFLAKAFVVLAINFSLFLIVPISQDVFGMFEVKEEKMVKKNKIVAEYIKPEKKEVRKKQKRNIRSVANSSSKQIKNPMKFKFSPDLSVGAGGGGVAVESQELKAEVFEEGDVDVSASVMFMPSIDYPDEAKELAIEGEVVVHFVVGENGKIATISKVDAPHNSFNRAIRKALAKAKFSPAQKNGVPVSQKMILPIDFKIDS